MLRIHMNLSRSSIRQGMKEAILLLAARCQHTATSGVSFDEPGPSGLRDSMVIPGSREDRLAHWFDLFDRNRDGIMTEADITNVGKSISSLLRLSVFDQRITAITDFWLSQWRQLNSSQTVQKQDWINHMNTLMPESRVQYSALSTDEKQMIDSMFQLQDTAGDGVIDHMEYRLFWGVLNPPNITQLQAREILLQMSNQMIADYPVMTLSRYRELYPDFMFDININSPARFWLGPLHRLQQNWL